MPRIIKKGKKRNYKRRARPLINNTNTNRVNIVKVPMDSGVRPFVPMIQAAPPDHTAAILTALIASAKANELPLVGTGQSAVGVRQMRPVQVGGVGPFTQPEGDQGDLLQELRTNFYRKVDALDSNPATPVSRPASGIQQPTKFETARKPATYSSIYERQKLLSSRGVSGVGPGLRRSERAAQPSNKYPEDEYFMDTPTSSMA